MTSIIRPIRFMVNLPAILSRTKDLGLYARPYEESMPETPPDDSAERLLKQLRELHSTSVAALDHMESQGFTSVPITNMRDIINAYMTVARRFAGLYAASIRDAQQRESAVSARNLVVYVAAALATGVTLGGAITIGLVLLSA